MQRNKMKQEGSLLGINDIEKIERFLVNGGDVNESDQCKRTPLMLNDDPEITKILIKYGANVHARDCNGLTALMYAVCAGNEQIVNILLDCGSDINAKNNNGNTILMQTMDEKIADVLLKRGADINAKDEYGSTALHLAENAKITKLLLEYGADINIKNRYGSTPLIHTLISEKAKLLIDYGADINAIGRNGKTAFLGSIASNNKNKAFLLISVPCNPFIGIDILHEGFYAKARSFLSDAAKTHAENPQWNESVTAYALASVCSGNPRESAWAEEWMEGKR